MSLQPTSDEIHTAAAILAKLEPGYLPEPIFDQVTRLVVTSTVVIVALKQTPDGPKVLLRMRGDELTNPIWPGHWHLPGTMLRPTDNETDYSSAFARLLKGELGMGDTTLSASLQYVRTAFTQTKRGREVTRIYYVQLPDEPVRGELFPVDDLPKPIIEHEVNYIREVAALFAKLEDDAAVAALAG